MADVTLTIADVRPLHGSIVRQFKAGSALTPGQAVALASDGFVDPADADSAALAQVIGVVVAGSSGQVSFATGDMVDVVIYGPVAGFSGMTKGSTLFNGVTAGKINHVPSSVAGDFAHIVGRAIAADIVLVDPAPVHLVKFALIDGGAAGNHTVTGIALGDQLLHVLHNTAGTLADLTSEFSISAADTIANAGGTATTSDQLLVVYLDLT